MGNTKPKTPVSAETILRYQDIFEIVVECFSFILWLLRMDFEFFNLVCLVEIDSDTIPGTSEAGDS
ncbi:MAG: hypothetical protein CW742_10120 [Methanoregula sp.]|nr:MAG: hypothetical protein CW742_10120 [Methanoregula sp.]